MQLLGLAEQGFRCVKIGLRQCVAGFLHFAVRLGDGIASRRAGRTRRRHVQLLAQRLEAFFVGGSEVQLVGRDAFDENGGLGGAALLQGGLGQGQLFAGVAAGLHR